MDGFPWIEEIVKNHRKAKPKKVELRSCRLDMRLTKDEKKKLEVRAKKTHRTITSIIAELIENME